VTSGDHNPPPRDPGRPVTLVRSYLSSGLLGRGGLSFLVAFVGVSLSAFAYHVVVSRLLGPSHYGAMGALLGIISLLTVPIGAVQIAVTQAVVDKESHHRHFSMGRVTRRAGLVGVGAAVLVFGVTPVIDNFLHLGSPLPMLCVGLWIPLATVTAVVQGALVGEYRFRPVACASFFGLGVARLLLGFVLVKVGWGVTGAVAATIGAQAVTMFGLVYSARHELREQSPEVLVLRTRVRDTVVSVAGLAGYTTLIGVDTFLANHFLVPTAAGDYSAVAVGAHIAFFVPAALVTVVFPHLADGQGTSQASRRVFRQSLYVSLVLSGLAAATMAGAPRLTVSVLFGAKYTAAAPILGVLALASVALGVVILFVYLHLARRSLWALSPWVGVVGSVIAIAGDHSSPRVIANIMLVVSLSTMLLIGLPGAARRPG
jgi:O-antigen/teichoic acid export membrane protein